MQRADDERIRPADSVQHPTESHPTTLFIFSFLSPSLTPSSSPSSSTSAHFHPRLHSLLVHQLPVKSFEWQPIDSGEVEKQESVAIATAEKGFTVWRAPMSSSRVAEDQEDEGGVAECVGVPSRAFSSASTSGPS